ncbi:MAG: hypothetical protein WBB39_00990 [Candidatus Saccharimonadales bacterium]
MLKIPKSPRISLPHLDLSASKPMQLSPVTDDGDELTQAVSDDPIDHDDKWELSDVIDEQAITDFWLRIKS